MKDIQKTYNQELKGVVNWLQANKLTLNVDKSNLILFKKGKQKTDELVIKIGKEQIKEKEYTKYLGLLIDNQLSWQHHIKHLNLKIVKGIGIISKLRHYVSKKTLRMLYFAFVQPHMEYGLVLWGNTNKTNINIVKRNHNKAVRKMLFKKYNQPTKPLFKELNILPFDQQIDYSILQFMWKVTHDELEENIKSLFRQRERTFGNNDIKYHIPNVNLDRTRYSIIFQGPRLWNKLNSDLKNKVSVNSFKKALKSHFLNKDDDS